MEQLRDFVREIAASLWGGEVLGLEGDLGAGKTTFTQMLAQELGVQAMVKSPTFTLMQEYEVDDNKIKKLVHVDAYRVEDSREFRVIGLFEEAGAEGTVTVVEWAEKVPELAHISGYRRLQFAVEEEKRFITVD